MSGTSPRSFWSCSASSSSTFNRSRLPLLKRGEKTFQPNFLNDLQDFIHFSDELSVLMTSSTHQASVRSSQNSLYRQKTPPAASTPDQPYPISALHDLNFCAQAPASIQPTILPTIEVLMCEKVSCYAYFQDTLPRMNTLFNVYFLTTVSSFRERRVEKHLISNAFCF